jgi:hypothetical protein
MTKEEKDIIIKDLCTRLPYSVMLETDNVFPQKLEGITFDNGEAMICVSDGAFTLDWMTCRPYLFPLSGLPEKKRKEYYALLYNPECSVEDLLEWCYKNHVDCNRLIHKGLAKDATGLDIY